MIGHAMKRLLIPMSLFLLWTSTASAQPGAGTLTEGKDGCTQCSPPHDQQRAQELFQEAKTFLEKEQYGDAAALYERALDRWDNPLIRYALARALYLQDRFLDAHAHVTEVLAYGAECFDPRMWENVQKLAEFLQEKLSGMGEIEIACHESGAQVDIDGMPGFICSEPMEQASGTCSKPEARVQIKNGWTITRRGAASRLVRPGTYRVTAIKIGHDTAANAVVVTANHMSRVEIDLAVKRPERRKPGWPVALGWSVTGWGAATVGVGGWLHYKGGDAKSGAMLAYGFGGTAMATGVAILLVHYNRDAPRERPDGNGITVLPLLGGDSAGAMIGLEF